MFRTNQSHSLNFDGVLAGVTPCVKQRFRMIASRIPRVSCLQQRGPALQGQKKVDDADETTMTLQSAAVI